MSEQTAIAEFPSHTTSYNQRMIRGPVNPLDKCTIFSIYPRLIVEKKWTLTPQEFIIPAGSIEKPGRLEVIPSCWWKEVDERQPLLEIPISSIQVADSIINDYCSTMVGVNPGDAMPGVFFIPGKITHSQLLSDYRPLLDKTETMQRKWFNVLIRIADSLWARSGGNPLAIPEEARLAVEQLHVERPWTQDIRQSELVRCIACGSLRNPQFPICPTCKAVVDSDKANNLGLKFAD